MEKIIRVNGVDVFQRSCTVDFNATIDLQHVSIELTHNQLYKLLETATDVKEINDGKTSKFVSFKQGIVQFEVYTRQHRGE